MLLKCPECSLQISDKALSCPHCGYPLKAKISPKTIKHKKHSRLPNGFGQISEIKGRNLRKPFRAMVTVGKNEYGRPICKPLKPDSYFKTYNEAYTALLKYNRNPYDLNKNISVEELFNIWYEDYSKNVVTARARTIKSVWKYCSSIYKLNIRDLKSYHIRNCMSNGTVENKNGKLATPTTATKIVIKSIFNMMLNYALEYELVDKNAAENISISKKEVTEFNNSHKKHIAYTDDEVLKIWNYNGPNQLFADLIKVQLYSGWRPTELCSLLTKNINLNDDIMKGGLKTKAGINRLIPIHPNIKPIIEKYYNEAIKNNNLYLFSRNGDKITYKVFSTNFIKLIEELNINREHKPHDGRKHFITKAKECNINEYAIKYIVGHSISDLTERVYTERNIEWLKTEMQKLK